MIPSYSQIAVARVNVLVEKPASPLSKFNSFTNFPTQLRFILL